MIMKELPGFSINDSDAFDLSVDKDPNNRCGGGGGGGGGGYNSSELNVRYHAQNVKSMHSFDPSPPTPLPPPPPPPHKKKSSYGPVLITNVCRKMEIRTNGVNNQAN